MGKLRMICAALAAVLMFGIYPAQCANAAPESKQAELQAVPAEKEPLTEQELAGYYGESVFIGDSIMLGFRNYCAKKKNTFVHDIQFLAVGSYSAHNAMKPVAGNNVHPLYGGKKYNVWDALPLIGRQRVFILLGMNDIGMLGLEASRDKYKALIDKILETSPDIEINIISATYTLKDKGKGKLNNNNIAKYNVMLKEMTDENGWGYIDLCTPISDGQGNLAKGCCSDGFVHLSNSAYSIWQEELVKYANSMAAEEAETGQTPATGEQAVPETGQTLPAAVEQIPPAVGQVPSAAVQIRN